MIKYLQTICTSLTSLSPSDGILFFKKNKFIIVLNSVFVVLSIGIIIFHTNYSPFIITLLSLILLLIYSILAVFSMIKSKRLEMIKKSLDEALLHNKILQSIQDNLFTSRHDFSNIMQAINGLLEDNDLIGLKEYFYETKKDYLKIDNLSKLSSLKVNNSALHSLIVSKYYLAEKLGISFSLSINSTLDNLPVSSYIMTKILGVLLDNAIDASKASSEKEILFSITASANNTIKRTVIDIQNSYSNKDVDIRKIFEKGYSSKDSSASPHGIGLWEVNDIIKKVKYVNLVTSKSDKYFRQSLEIYQKTAKE